MEIDVETSKTVNTEELLGFIGEIHELHGALKDSESLRYKLKEAKQLIAKSQAQYRSYLEKCRNLEIELGEYRKSYVTNDSYNLLQDEYNNLVNESQIQYQKAQQELADVQNDNKQLKGRLMRLEHNSPKVSVKKQTKAIRGVDCELERKVALLEEKLTKMKEIQERSDKELSKVQEANLHLNTRLSCVLREKNQIQEENNLLRLQAVTEPTILDLPEVTVLDEYKVNECYSVPEHLSDSDVSSDEIQRIFNDMRGLTVISPFLKSDSEKTHGLPRESVENVPEAKKTVGRDWKYYKLNKRWFTMRKQVLSTQKKLQQLNKSVLVMRKRMFNRRSTKSKVRRKSRVSKEISKLLDGIPSWNTEHYFSYPSSESEGENDVKTKRKRCKKQKVQSKTNVLSDSVEIETIYEKPLSVDSGYVRTESGGESEFRNEEFKRNLKIHKIKKRYLARLDEDGESSENDCLLGFVNGCYSSVRIDLPQNALDWKNLKQLQNGAGVGVDNMEKQKKSDPDKLLVLPPRPSMYQQTALFAIKEQEEASCPTDCQQKQAVDEQPLIPKPSTSQKTNIFEQQEKTCVADSPHKKTIDKQVPKSSIFQILEEQEKTSCTMDKQIKPAMNKQVASIPRPSTFQKPIIFEEQEKTSCVTDSQQKQIMDKQVDLISRSQTTNTFEEQEKTSCVTDSFQKQATDKQVASIPQSSTFQNASIFEELETIMDTQLASIPNLSTFQKTDVFEEQEKTSCVTDGQQKKTMDKQVASIPRPYTSQKTNIFEEQEKTCCVANSALKKTIGKQVSKSSIFQILEEQENSSCTMDKQIKPAMNKQVASILMPSVFQKSIIFEEQYKTSCVRDGQRKQIMDKQVDSISRSSTSQTTNTFEEQEKTSSVTDSLQKQATNKQVASIPQPSTFQKASIFEELETITDTQLASIPKLSTFQKADVFEEQEKTSCVTDSQQKKTMDKPVASIPKLSTFQKTNIFEEQEKTSCVTDSQQKKTLDKQVASIPRPSTFQKTNIFEEQVKTETSCVIDSQQRLTMESSENDCLLGFVNGCYSSIRIDLPESALTWENLKHLQDGAGRKGSVVEQNGKTANKSLDEKQSMFQTTNLFEKQEKTSCVADSQQKQIMDKQVDLISRPSTFQKTDIFAELEKTSCTMDKQIQPVMDKQVASIPRPSTFQKPNIFEEQDKTSCITDSQQKQTMPKQVSSLPKPSDTFQKPNIFEEQDKTSCVTDSQQKQTMPKQVASIPRPSDTFQKPNTFEEQEKTRCVSEQEDPPMYKQVFLNQKPPTVEKPDIPDKQAISMPDRQICLKAECSTIQKTDIIQTHDKTCFVSDHPSPNENLFAPTKMDIAEESATDIDDSDPKSSTSNEIDVKLRKKKQVSGNSKPSLSKNDVSLNPKSLLLQNTDTIDKQEIFVADKEVFYTSIVVQDKQISLKPERSTLQKTDIIQIHDKTCFISDEPSSNSNVFTLTQIDIGKVSVMDIEVSNTKASTSKTDVCEKRTFIRKKQVSGNSKPFVSKTMQKQRSVVDKEVSLHPKSLSLKNTDTIDKQEISETDKQVSSNPVLSGLETTDILEIQEAAEPNKLISLNSVQNTDQVETHDKTCFASGELSTNINWFTPTETDITAKSDADINVPNLKPGTSKEMDIVKKRVKLSCVTNKKVSPKSKNLRKRMRFLMNKQVSLNPKPLPKNAISENQIHSVMDKQIFVSSKPSVCYNTDKMETQDQCEHDSLSYKIKKRVAHVRRDAGPIPIKIARNKADSNLEKACLDSEPVTTQPVAVSKVFIVKVDKKEKAAYKRPNKTKFQKLQEEKVLPELDNLPFSSDPFMDYKPSEVVARKEEFYTDSPASPDPEPMDEPPAIQISLHQATATLQQLLHFPKSANVAQHVTDTFLHVQPHLTVQLVLNYIVNDIHDKIRIFNQRRAPLLTITQQVLLGLLVELEEKRKFVIDLFLMKAEQIIFATKIDTRLEPIARFHAAICKLRFDYKRMRLLMFRAAVEMQEMAVPYLNIVIHSWFELVPVKNNRTTELAQLETRAFLQILRLKKPDNKLHCLFQLFKNYHGYSLELDDNVQILDGLFKYYIGGRSEAVLYLTIGMIRHMANSNIIFDQMDGIKRCIKLSENEEEMSAAIRLIGIATSQFLPNSNQREKFDVNIKWLKEFQSDSYSDYIRNIADMVLEMLDEDVKLD